MRIVIDMQGAQSGSRFRGIGRYTMAFTQALLRNATDEYEIFLVLNGLYPDTVEPIRHQFHGLIPSERIMVWYSATPVAFMDSQNDWRRASGEILREAFIESLKPDFLIISSLIEGASENVITSVHSFDRKTKTAVILYDLIPLIYEKDYLPTTQGREWYFNKLDHLKKADLWFAISESSKREGIEHLQLPAERIFNISAAVDPTFTAKDFTEDFSQAMRRKFGLTKKFVMYSGSSDARKNILRLIGAYSKLPQTLRREHQLLVAGGMPLDHRNHIESYIRSHGLSMQDVVLSGHINDEEMLWFYCNCDSYVFPSYHEGFGFPALEAMACGKAVIGANTTSVPEVIGSLEALFDPFSETEIAKSMERVLTDAAFRRRLEVNGREQAAGFSWDHTARLALEALARFPVERAEPGSSEAELEGRLIEALSSVDTGTVKPSNNDLLTVALCANRILPRAETVRYLYVDVSELYKKDAGTGIQRVVRSIITAWDKQGVFGFEVVPVYASLDDCYRHTKKFSNAKHLLQFMEGEPIDPRSGDVFLGLDLNDLLIDSKRGYFKQIKALGLKTYFVVYDLLPVNCSENFPPDARINFENWLHTITEADGAICISRSVADELESWLESKLKQRITPFHIGWFHLGADLEGSVPSQGLPDNASKVLGKLDANPSFLMVGTLEPRKRHHQVLAGFELLWAQGIDVNLVMVGKQGWMVDPLIEQIKSHPELGRRLFWITAASDEYLDLIYQTCDCLIAASEGEGFGLPLIEAAKHRLPIIARDLPVFKEVAGKHAVYFNGSGAKDLSEAVETWLSLKAEGRVPASEAISWLTWNESARQLSSLVENGSWYKTWPN
ncbi:glycosyltransferase family 1 protein [Pseudomonas sp.]|uniref:glycosyltransferase family 4 protein n=1 Tax=Pseudomonas sp. TaxID=306 RepID=UPI002899A4C8|nr:glycosyltransferase family 1 protein [Pseudomonas sp.]